MSFFFRYKHWKCIRFDLKTTGGLMFTKTQNKVLEVSNSKYWLHILMSEWHSDKNTMWKTGWSGTCARSQRKVPALKKWAGYMLFCSLWNWCEDGKESLGGEEATVQVSVIQAENSCVVSWIHLLHHSSASAVLTNTHIQTHKQSSVLQHQPLSELHGINAKLNVFCKGEVQTA